MTTDQTCGLCAHTSFEAVKTGVDFSPKTNVHRCNNCKVVCLSPMPTQSELGEFYAKEYREVYDPECTVLSRFEADLPEAKIRSGRLKGLLSKDTKVLEIGSGTGAFLSTAAPLVKTINGVELHDRSCEWIRDDLNIPVFRTLDELPDGGDGYDLIVMFHVLEHIPDPVDFLSGLAPRLAPGGKIVVEVPNVDDVLVTDYAVQGLIDMYYTLAHLFYYSALTLNDVAQKAGLNADVTCVQRYDLSNHLRWALTDKPGGQGYYNAFIGEDTAKSYANDLIKSGKADTLWAVCEP